MRVSVVYDDTVRKPCFGAESHYLALEMEQNDAALVHQENLDSRVEGPFKIMH